VQVIDQKLEENDFFLFYQKKNNLKVRTNSKFISFSVLFVFEEHPLVITNRAEKYINEELGRDNSYLRTTREIFLFIYCYYFFFVLYEKNGVKAHTNSTFVLYEKNGVKAHTNSTFVLYEKNGLKAHTNSTCIFFSVLLAFEGHLFVITNSAEK